MSQAPQLEWGARGKRGGQGHWGLAILSLTAVSGGVHTLPRAWILLHSWATLRSRRSQPPRSGHGTPGAPGGPGRLLPGPEAPIHGLTQRAVRCVWFLAFVLVPVRPTHAVSGSRVTPVRGSAALHGHAQARVWVSAGGFWVFPVWGYEEGVAECFLVDLNAMLPGQTLGVEVLGCSAGVCGLSGHPRSQAGLVDPEFAVTTSGSVPAPRPGQHFSVSVFSHLSLLCL